MSTVTVTCPPTTPFGRKSYTLTFSKLPGQKFGPFGLAEAIQDLTVSALLDPLAARSLVMDAATGGSATTETGE